MRILTCDPSLTESQRDYFGAHTFRVLPGKENSKFKTGEDIRVYHFFVIFVLKLILFPRRQLDWTWRKRLCLDLQYLDFLSKPRC